MFPFLDSIQLYSSLSKDLQSSAAYERPYKIKEVEDGLEVTFTAPEVHQLPQRPGSSWAPPNRLSTPPQGRVLILNGNQCPVDQFPNGGSLPSATPNGRQQVPRIRWPGRVNSPDLPGLPDGRPGHPPGSNQTLDCSPSPAPSAAAPCNKVSEMYLRKINPSTGCLYSAASIRACSLSTLARSTALKSLADASFFALRRLPAAEEAGAW